MIALAFGPGSVVLISGAFNVGPEPVMPTRLLRLPPRDRASILEHDAARIEVLADAVGLGEVARLPRCLARRNHRLDFLDRHRRTFVLVPAQRENPEHLVEAFECRANAWLVPGRQLA